MIEFTVRLGLRCLTGVLRTSTSLSDDDDDGDDEDDDDDEEEEEEEDDDDDDEGTNSRDSTFLPSESPLALLRADRFWWDADGAVEGAVEAVAASASPFFGRPRPRRVAGEPCHFRFNDFRFKSIKTDHIK